MRLLVQWAFRKAQDWDEIDTTELPSISPKPAPDSSSKLDNKLGWINAINIQGVVIAGWDHYYVAYGADWIEVTCWSDDLTYPETYHTAAIYRFETLAPDPNYGNAWNTRQVRIYYGMDVPESQNTTVLEWQAFVQPAGRVFHGKMLTDEEYLEHKASQSFHSWREWTEGVPEEEIIDGKVRDQRDAGNWKLPQGTRTYYLSDTEISQSLVKATYELEAKDSAPGTEATVTVDIRKNSGELTHSWTCRVGTGIDTSWPSGEYRCILDVSTAGADLTYQLSGRTYGGFSQYDPVAYTIQETIAQDEAGFSGTGIKTASYTGAWTDNTTTGYCMICVVNCDNANSKDTQYLGIDVNLSDHYMDGPWAGSGTNIDATVGNSALCSYSATVESAVAIAATCGQSALRAYAAEVEQGILVSADASQVALCSYAAEVSAGATIAATATQVALCGYAAEVFAGETVDAIATQVALCSYVAEVEQGINIASSLCAIAICSFTSEVLQGTSCLCSATSVAVSSYAADIPETISISATVGTLACVSFQSDVTQDIGYISSAQEMTASISGLPIVINRTLVLTM